ncbi:MAG TPA: cupin domain-containing protein [Candidatus Binataceae bacterium]|nr:cupin domain-containing protein [Candidatus Binataceae bacterium]
MNIVRQAQTKAFELDGNHMIGLATPQQTAQEIEVWRGRMDAGAATPPHQHDHEEVVVILGGRGRARIASDEFEFQPGDTLLLPAGKVHQLFAETEAELISAMPIGSVIRTAAGEIMELPWRR